MPDNIREIFVKNLNYFMKKRGISQADICRDLNVSSATASDWCNGKKHPRPDAIGQLADLLGVRFSMLTTEDGPINYEDQERIEAFHRNPKLRMLFDIQKNLGDSDLDAVLGVTQAIAKERGDDD
jgi:transcriptional regulator with XRE-family HTH domain